MHLHRARRQLSQVLSCELRAEAEDFGLLVETGASTDMPTGWHETRIWCLFVSIYTLLQKSVLDAFRGRVFGAYSTNNMLLLLLGLSVSSVFAGQTGVISMMYAMGAFYFLAGVIAFWLL